MGLARNIQSTFPIPLGSPIPPTNWSVRLVWMLTASLVVVSACADLHSLEENTCGNRVVEPEVGEDCDGESNCISSGSAYACRFMCVAGGTPQCPTGFSCGYDGVCRQPSGSFELVYSEVTNNTTNYAISDLNGDGCSEIIRNSGVGYGVTSLPNSEGASYSCPSLNQFIGMTPPNEPGNSPPRASGGLPAVGPFGSNSDAMNGFVVSNTGLSGNGLYTFVAEQDPTVYPLLYLSTPLTKAGQSVGDVYAVSIKRSDGSHAFVFFIGPTPSIDGTPVKGSAELRGLLDPKVELEVIGPSPTFPSDIIALTVGDIDLLEGTGFKCDEIIFAESPRADALSASEIQILSVCVESGFKKQDYLLPPVRLAMDAVFPSPRRPGRSDQAGGGGTSLAAIDYNLDGAIDLLANDSVGRLHISYGVGDGRFHSTAEQLPQVKSGTLQADRLTSLLPIQGPGPGVGGGSAGGPPMGGHGPGGSGSGGGLPGPMAASFVVGHFDQASSTPSIVTRQCPRREPLQSPACHNMAWATTCQMVVLDLDNDGNLDYVVAEGGRSGLLYHKGNGEGKFNTFEYPTTCTPTNLTVGDFDGDHIDDLAFYDQQYDLQKDESNATLTVMYGAPAPQLFETLVFGRFPLSDARRGLAAAVVKGGPPISSLAAVAPTGSALYSLALGLAEGSTARLMLAPYYLGLEQSGGHSELEIIATTRGQFTAGAGSLAALTEPIASSNEGGTGAGQGLRLTLLEVSAATGQYTVSNNDDEQGELTCNRCVASAIDVDGDGVDELLLAGEQRVAVYTATTGAGFALLEISEPAYRFYRYTDGNPPLYTVPPTIADLNGDGYLDVLLPAQGSDTADEDYSVVALWGHGDGTFVATEFYQDEHPDELPAFTLLNVDVDVAPELAWLDRTTGKVLWYDVDLNSGLPTKLTNIAPLTFSNPAVNPGPGNAPSPARVANTATGDVNGDGLDDLLIASSLSHFSVYRSIPLR